jgi:hypothetical protein
VSKVKLPIKSNEKKVSLYWIVLVVSAEDDIISPTKISFIPTESSEKKLEKIAELVSDEYTASGPGVQLQKIATVLRNGVYMINVCEYVQIYIGRRKEKEYMCNNIHYLNKYIL